MFPAKYDMTKGLPGAPVAHLDLFVDAPKRKISGKVTITQAVKNDAAPSTDVEGWYEQRQDGEVIAVINSKPPTKLGTMEFRALMVLPRWGEAGEGGFHYTAGSTNYESDWVPATPIEVAATANV